MNGTTQTAAWKGNWALPMFVTAENKYRSGLLIFAITGFFYMMSNHHPIFPPQLLPMTWIDQATPFMPHTVWIYMSDYVFAFVVYALCRDMANINRLCYSFFALQMLSITTFFLWPTTFPRDQFPLPADLDSITAYAFTVLREADSPHNCLPSLHVSTAFLASFAFLDEQKEKFKWFVGWATAIAITTMTTKQHYLADILSAVALAIVLYLIFHRWVPYYTRHAKR
jgi:membrane-associated phospholipid phosphatase